VVRSRVCVCVCECVCGTLGGVSHSTLPTSLPPPPCPPCVSGQYCSSNRISPGDSVYLSAYAGNQYCWYSVDAGSGMYARVDFGSSTILRSYDYRKSARPNAPWSCAGQSSPPVVTGSCQLLSLCCATCASYNL
jgi:hypothetical protein